jgi:hypothetical protein
MSYELVPCSKKENRADIRPVFYAQYDAVAAALSAAILIRLASLRALLLVNACLMISLISRTSFLLFIMFTKALRLHGVVWRVGELSILRGNV